MSNGRKVISVGTNHDTIIRFRLLWKYKSVHTYLLLLKMSDTASYCSVDVRIYHLNAPMTSELHDQFLINNCIQLYQLAKITYQVEKNKKWCNQM